ncbi:glycosyltransferase [Parvibaculum sp.]|uniref:glycosyltransferase family 2 protein n=1 Tax=Parvibaculum sp. TaxID=2024848 RepID=UPI001D81493A|nr:glycosyltransferase [Parvibaculum sp.]MBX3489205.1 glycosyltransferase [Parvibaculum sp.]
MTIRVSVVIPHYNDLDNLRQCIALLEVQSLPRGSFEILVADNNSPLDIEAVAAAAGPGARALRETRKGAGLARNCGAAAASGEVLAFIDSDCRPAADWLEKGLAALESCDVVGGRVRVGRGKPGALTPAEAFECIFAFDIESYVTKKRFVPSGNMFVRRATFGTVGGFRGGVSEDVEWGRRAAGMGLRLAYGHEVVVEHPARATWTELKAKWRRMSLESYLLMRERRFGRLKWLLRSWAVLLSPLIHVWQVLRSPELEAPADRLKAIAALFAIRIWRFVEAHRVMWRTR